MNKHGNYYGCQNCKYAEENSIRCNYWDTHDEKTEESCTWEPKIVKEEATNEYGYRAE